MKITIDLEKLSTLAIIDIHNKLVGKGCAEFSAAREIREYLDKTRQWAVVYLDGDDKK